MADPLVDLLLTLEGAVTTRVEAAKKLADAVANQTSVNQAAAAQTKAANGAVTAAKAEEDAARKALNDALDKLQGRPVSAPVNASRPPPPPDPDA